MVTSFFPGRVRLRAPVFKDKLIVDTALKILRQSDAVKNVENNIKTGSVLLEYDPNRVPVEKLKPLVPFFMDLRQKALGFSGDEVQRQKILEKLNEFDAMVKTW